MGALKADTSPQDLDQAQEEGTGTVAADVALEGLDREAGSQGSEQAGSARGREQAAGPQQDGGPQQQELQSLEWLAREVLQFSQEAGMVWGKCSFKAPWARTAPHAIRHFAQGGWLLARSYRALTQTY
eukprot:scaffold318255_cov17-Tisochrysis_lutea.AAC.1